MSLCPTKDIHSVYLDNELSLSYVKEYELHVQSCPRCLAELEKVKKLRQVLADCDVPEMSSFEMEEGFKRLQIRMSYSKHTKSVEKKPVLSTLKYAVPAMAAAAVFAIVLPVGQGKSKKVETSEIAQASITNLPLISGNAVNSGINGFSGNRNSMMKPGMRPTNVMNEKMPQVVDVFRPNFDNENTISIKITIPGMNTVPYTTEIDVPVDMYKGSLSETN